MINVKRISLCLVLVINSGFTLAYEVETHEKLSEEAHNGSIIAADQDLLQHLGIKSSDEFLNSKNEKKTIVELIKDGARFEDEVIKLKSLFHFFDPINDQGLLFFTSPTWALEDKGKIHLLQNYSFSDARDTFYEALTATSEDQRKTKFGNTFESLGHVIHHIQDMGQPQHVRLDPHLNLNWTEEELPFEKRSRYEEYTKGKGSNLPFNTYAPVNSKGDTNFLIIARSFWHTGQGGGLGLAEFSNRNFISAGTNFDTDRYPSPTLGNATPWDDNANSLLEREGLTVPPECLPPNQPCVMTFYRTRVQDNYRSAESKDNDYTSTLSIFDQDLQAQNKRAFSLNRFNFNAAHEFLIPRAVAYSAGLIDYFFRGKLEAEDVIFTDTGISLRVKNAIDPQKTPAWQNELLYAKNTNGLAGSFTVAFDYQDSTGKTQYGVSNTVPVRASDTLAPGQVSTDVYDFSLIVPSEAKDVNYRLVFRGKLGQEEDAVAVGPAVPISGFIFNPSYIPADGITGSRVIYQQGDRWRLTDQQNRVAGNIDWKGWYRNGKPTKVLSWVGPSSRYFPKTYDPKVAGYSSPVDTKIYQNGEIFAVAPPVLGAALYRDSIGKEWLVVISQDALADVVYRRPNIKNNSPAGWQQIGRFYRDPTLLNTANTPWFFNGSGTEAQTIRSGYKAGDPKVRLFRLKISIAENNVTLSNEGNLDDDANVGAFTGTKTCEENVPAPGSCASNCTGTYTEDLSFSNMVTIQTEWSGSSIIAVDYIQDTPVFATYSSRTNTAYSLSISWIRSTNTTCNGRFLGGACRTNSSWEIEDTRHVEKHHDIVNKISMSGFGDIVMESTSGTLRIDATQNQLGLNNTTLSTTTDKSGGGSYEHSTSRLRYLDLRYGLYSLRTETRASSGQTTDVKVFDTGPFNSYDYAVFLPQRNTIKQVTGYNGELPVHQIELPENIVPYPLDDHKLNLNCNSTVTNPGSAPRQVFLDLGVLFSGGAWAVDSNENLFLSESKLDKDMRGIGGFNYLTGAMGEDPGSVIPTAPQGIYYYDKIGVVK